MNASYHLRAKPEFESASLVVAWGGDMSGLGTRVADYLIRKLSGQVFADIEPAEFFSLSGVTVDNDVAQFPESRFYACPKNSLAVFVSDPPAFNWYSFLSLVLDIAQEHCRVKELYAIGGLVSSSAHTAPRGLMGTFSSLEFKTALDRYDIAGELTYETPSDQKPTLNSFLLWAARRRNIPGVCIWVPIPFYLLSVGDPQSEKKVIEFLSQRLSLPVDFSDLDAEIRHQNEEVARLRGSAPDINDCIGRLESNQALSKEENDALVQRIGESIKGRRVPPPV